MRNLTSLAILLLTIGFLMLQGCGEGSTMSATEGGNGGNGNSSHQDDTTSSRETAPDFTYFSLNGDEYSLSDLKGNVVYLFFFGSNCPHCRDNGPVTEEIYQQFKDNSNFVALGLDTWNTSASEVNSFKNVTGITYPLLLMAKESLIEYYGSASSYDRSVVVDPDGNIAYKGTDFADTDSEQVKSVVEDELSQL